MKDRKQRTFEFLTLLCMIVGVVIGTGEFVKNDNEKGTGHILDATHNGWMSILLWVLIGMACIFMMLCFIEVASSTSKLGNGTISTWARIFINRRVGSFLSLFWVFIYTPIIYSLFSLMIVQYLLMSFHISPEVGSLKYTMIYIFGSLGFLLFFTLLNTYFRTTGKYFQIIGTFLKLIPFILILLIGFIFPAHPNVFTRDDYQTWNVTNFFTATGPILYSFDGFIFAANLQKETKNKDVVYKALLIGILVIVIVYVLEAIALFSGTDSGSVIDLFANVFHTKNINLIFDLMIVFAIMTGLNGFSIAASNFINTDTEQGLLYKFSKKMNLKKSSLFQIFLAIIWLTIFLILGLVIDNGIHQNAYNPMYYADLFSNVVVTFAFIGYIIVLIGCVVNRFTKKVKVIKVKNMILYGIISFVVLTICIIYSLYITILNFDTTTYLLIGTIVGNLLLFLINEILLKTYSKKYDDIETEIKLNETYETIKELHASST